MCDYYAWLSFEQREAGSSSDYHGILQVRFRESRGILEILAHFAIDEEILSTNFLISEVNGKNGVFYCLESSKNNSLKSTCLIELSFGSGGFVPLALYGTGFPVITSK